MKFIKMTALIMLTAVAFSMYGCVDIFRSFFPIHTKDTLTYKKELLGTWQKECLYDDDIGFDDEDFAEYHENKDPVEKYIFHKKEKDGSYKVERIDAEGKSTLLKVCLVKVGDGNYFLDIVPYKNIKKSAGMGCLVIFHMIAKINFLDDLIEMLLFRKNLKWIDRDDMSSVEKDLVTTGKIGKMSTNSSTEDVIEFLEKYGNREEVFSQIYAQRFKKVE